METELNELVSLEDIKTERNILQTKCTINESYKLFVPFMDKLQSVLHTAGYSVNTDTNFTDAFGCSDSGISTLSSVKDITFVSNEIRGLQNKIQKTSSRFEEETVTIKDLKHSIEKTNKELDAVSNDLKELKNQEILIEEEFIRITGLGKRRDELNATSGRLKELRIQIGIAENGEFEKGLEKCRLELEELNQKALQKGELLQNRQEEELALQRIIKHITAQEALMEQRKAKAEIAKLIDDESQQQWASDKIEIEARLVSASIQKARDDYNIKTSKEGKLFGEIEALKNDLNMYLLNVDNIYQSKKKQYNKVSERLRETTEKAHAIRGQIVETHQNKLREINTTYLNDRWVELYPRDDITQIRLCAELKNVSDSRVDYEYHFEMVTGPNLGLKMRGRSSLGEKCLASIIIRYALADVFAKDCGVFGFDAPDGNLDDSVTENLIALLIQLSNRRQIIVTSPCGDFVKKLKEKCDGPDQINRRIYNVSKINGCSQVQIEP